MRYRVEARQPDGGFTTRAESYETYWEGIGALDAARGHGVVVRLAAYETSPDGVPAVRVTAVSAWYEF